MPVSKYCATQFKAKWTGYLYTLRIPDDGAIFYVGKTQDMKGRLLGHIAESRPDNQKKRKTQVINALLKAGKKPTMALIEKFDIRTRYDSDYYDYKEMYWIRRYLECGWDLTNIQIKDVLQYEVRYKAILASSKNGGNLPVNDFYYGIDHKGFPVYDLKKISDLGYYFSKDDFASHWAYIIDFEKYENVRETTMDYIYGDIYCEENRNKNFSFD